MCVLSKRCSENSFWVKKTLGVDELLQEEKKAAWRPRFVWKERHLSKGKRKGWAGHCVGKPERGCASWLGLGGEVREEPVQWKYLGGNPKRWRTSSLYHDFTNPQWSIRPAYWCLAEASLVCFIFLWKPRRGWGLSQDQDESRSRVSPWGPGGQPTVGCASLEGRSLCASVNWGHTCSVRTWLGSCPSLSSL